MAKLVNYKGIKVLYPDPTGSGGLAINNSFKSLVDWNPKSQWNSTGDPTVDDDIGPKENYQVGSFWLNRSTNNAYLCVDATDGAADWRSLPVGAFQSKRRSSILTINSTALVSTDLVFEVREGETWRFEVNLFATSLDAKAELQCRVDGPGEGHFSFINSGFSQVESAGMNSQTTALKVSTGGGNLIQINGIIESSGDGFVDPKIGNGSTDTAQSFNEWSYLIAQRID